MLVPLILGSVALCCVVVYWFTYRPRKKEVEELKKKWLLADTLAETYEESARQATAKAAVFQDKMEHYIEVVSSQNKVLTSYEEDIKTLTHQKKSSEVRTGLIAEQMAPFLDGFPYGDPKTATFLGKPLDFIVFNDTGVHFVEVKSGAARLSPKQRRIRDQIKQGKVSFEVYRIKGE